MEERNEISVELSTLSALMSGIGRQTPYRAPVGYFDQLPATVLSRVAPTYQVPDGYFDGFAARVLARIKTGTPAEEELPPLFRELSRITPYQVPQGYFDELSPVLTVAHDRPTYGIPEEYFAGLPGRILEKITGPVALPSQPAALPNQPVTLPSRPVALPARPVPAAKVIPMERAATGKVLKGNWWKYSSAAAIAACLLLIFSWPQPDNKVTQNAQNAATADIPRALQKVSDQEIRAYLDDQRAMLTEPVTNTTATLDMNEGDVKSFVGEVSDSELQQYMEEHGKAEDLATN